METDDEKLMDEAIELARMGEGSTRPNPPVGAVVVRKGLIVGCGYHKLAGEAHAEVLALGAAGGDAVGAKLYVTLEPCSTHGRTPPCTDLIMRSGVREVVVGARDPNPLHSGKGLTLLQRSGIKVIRDVRKAACTELIVPFATWVARKRPFITLKLATTLDGRIADRRGHSRWITGGASRARVQELRSRCDAILVGSGTAIADNPSLRYRKRRSMPLYRIIVDSRGRLPRDARVLTDGHAAETIIAVDRETPEPRITAFEEKGAVVWRIPTSGDHVSLRRLAGRLGRLGLLHVVCEGGGRLAEALLRADLVDRLMLFIAPTILGDTRSVPAVGGPGWLLGGARKMRFLTHERVGDDLLVTAEPVPAARDLGSTGVDAECSRA